MRSIVIGRFTRTHQDGRTDFEKILGYKKKKKRGKRITVMDCCWSIASLGIYRYKSFLPNQQKERRPGISGLLRTSKDFFFFPFRRRLVPIDATISFSRFVRSLLVNHVVTTPCRHVAIASSSPSCDVGVVVRL